ncbi:MAG TPA: crosslink repair DNA glycosylase YcaQ family protein, partial [Solirubrobacterales bacterium]|nr:crosslink repair DNA glycosylase YcaQ family protein [Solirubrobacterales bacterium]
MKRLRREEARRIAVRAQLLDADGRRDLPAVLERLTFLQLDPTATVAPSADLVAWSRLGDAYRPADLQNALEMERTVFEHRAQDVSIEPILALLRPVSSLGLYLAEMRAWPPPEWGRVARWLEANDAFRRRLLDQLRAEGPLKSSDIKDTSAVSWQSSGWTNDRNVTQMLEFLASRGEVAVAGRQGRQRLWDVAERIFPVDVAAVPVEVALAERDRRRLRSLGIARPQYAGGAGVEVEVEGTQGVWRLDPDATAEGFRGRIVLLSPFDRLVHNRAR